jgi:hypothetical protein
VNSTKYPFSCYLLSLEPLHSSGGYTPATQHGSPSSLPGQSMWDFWWTKWHWGKFISEYFGFPLWIITLPSSILSSVIRDRHNGPAYGWNTQEPSHPTALINTESQYSPHRSVLKPLHRSGLLINIFCAFIIVYLWCCCHFRIATIKYIIHTYIIIVITIIIII